LSASFSDFPYEVVVVAIWWSREGGSDADDTVERVFDTAHFGVDILGRKRGEVLMGPGMGCDHVSLVVSKFDSFDVFVVIDASV
jgi:hypothetical protein